MTELLKVCVCGCVFVYHTIDYMLVLELSCILTNLTKRNVCVCVGYGLAMYVLKDMQDLDYVYIYRLVS